MYDDLYYLRKKYGEVYVTVFPDETIVPWKQLSLQDYLHYSDKLSSGRFPPSHIEDEIFRKCCVDETLVANLDLLEAGIVTTTVIQIMEVSGPSSIEDLDYDLNIARAQVQDFISDGIGLICQTFPGYKPEDLYGLDYQTFMKRLALAERRLLSMGILQEPITIEVPGKEQVQVRSRRDMVKQRFADLNPSPVTSPTTEAPSHISNDIVIKQSEMRDTKIDLGGHDLLDKALWEHDVMDGLEYIYPEYFEKLKNGETITPEVINSVKGRTVKEVKEKHKEYIQKLKSGEIQPEKAKYLIADKIDGRAASGRPKKKVKVTVKRG